MPRAARPRAAWPAVWRRPAAAAALLGAALLGGCRPRTVDDEALPLTPTKPPPAARVVALVNGVPILDSDVALQLRAASDRRQALRSLVRLELLAQEARRRGRGADPRVVAAQRRAMAEALLAHDFTRGFTKKDVPRELIEAAYRLNLIMYVHPEYVRVAHILARVDPRSPGEAQREGLRLAQRVHAIAASGRLAEQEFTAISALVQKEARGVTLKAESLSTPRRGVTVPAFADAAFALAKPGDVSPVTPTEFGYHVIYLAERVAAANRPLSAVEDEIRERVFVQAREQAFLKYVAALEKQFGTTTDAEVLQRFATGAAPKNRGAPADSLRWGGAAMQAAPKNQAQP